jgi:ketosteroid isomerase-like protein
MSVRRAVMALGAAALLAAAGCGGKAAATARPVSQGEAKARQEARAVIDEVYRALRSGDTDDLLSMMSDDVVVLGPRPADLLRSRAEVVTALRERLDGRKKTRFASQGLRLAIGPGGGSAYAVDRVQLAGRPVVALAILEGERAIWRVRAVHLQAPLAGAAMKKALAAGALGAPAGTAEPPLGAGEAAARELAQRLAKVGSWVAGLEGDDEAVVIGADGAMAAGGKAIGRAASRLADVRLEATSPVAAVVSGDGQLAMATCTATRTTARDDREGGDRSGGKGSGKAEARGKSKRGKGATRTEAEEPPRTVRVTAILQREGGGWRLRAFAEAHALAEPAAPATRP